MIYGQTKTTIEIIHEGNIMLNETNYGFQEIGDKILNHELEFSSMFN